MARITPQQAGSQNRCTFLDLIGWSEGTVTDPVTKDDGYDVLVTGINGPARFNGYIDHPNQLVVVNHSGLKSTAAGRYQILYRYWKVYKVQMGLYDFSPLSQDRVALQMIRECHAMGDIDSGNVAEAIRLCSSRWASMPGNSYGQNAHPLSDLLTKWKELTTS